MLNGYGCYHKDMIRYDVYYIIPIDWLFDYIFPDEPVVEDYCI